MHPRFRTRALFAAISCFSLASLASGQVVINEFQYDDTGTDDREFVELFNAGALAIDISGWVISSEDQTAGTVSLPAFPSGTILNPGAYYVIGQASVPNVNQVYAGTGSLQNDMETLELRNGATIVDAVIYEVNKGSFSTGSLTSLAGPGLWMNHQGVDSTAGLTNTTLARYQDGRNTANNGRDFGMRPSTPGANNNPAGVMTTFIAPNVDALADLAVVPGFAGSFVNARAITPGVVSAANPNAIPAPNNGISKAIVAWDNSGGGNGVVSEQIFTNSIASFEIQAYLDTNDLPVQINNATPQVQFRGSENTFYGLLGSIDAFTNLSDVSGTIIGTGSTSAFNGASGLSGIAWYYEKVGVGVTGAPVSEKLYLIDANDGGNGNSAGGTAPFDFSVLATIDLSSTASGWFNLGITVDAAGNGVATFNGQSFNFTTGTNLLGSFYVGYRENLQEGPVGVPSYARPATFAAVPEPTSLALLAAGSLLAVRRRRD